MHFDWKFIFWVNDCMLRSHPAWILWHTVQRCAAQVHNWRGAFPSLSRIFAIHAKTLNIPCGKVKPVSSGGLILAASHFCFNFNRINALRIWALYSEQHFFTYVCEPTAFYTISSFALGRSTAQMTSGPWEIPTLPFYESVSLEIYTVLWSAVLNIIATA